MVVTITHICPYDFFILLDYHIYGINVSLLLEHSLGKGYWKLAGFHVAQRQLSMANWGSATARVMAIATLTPMVVSVAAVAAVAVAVVVVAAAAARLRWRRHQKNA